MPTSPVTSTWTPVSSAVSRTAASGRDSPRSKFKALTEDEATTLLKAARGDRLYALYAVALALGLRRGEALGLRWADVDFDQELIYVRQAVHRVSGKLEVGPVKTDESERTVALPKPLATALREWKAEQDSEREAAGNRWHDHDLIFPNNDRYADGPTRATSTG
jgi:integrase